MKAWVIVAVAGVLLFVLAAFGLLGSCERDKDIPGQRADSVLASDWLYRQRIQVQDSTIAHLEDSIRATDRDRTRWQRLALASLRRDDSLQASVDSTVSAGVPDSIPAAVFWKDRWTDQRRITAGLFTKTVPALLATIAADSLGIAQRDEYGAEMRSQRDFARVRAREVTAEFARYREASKPGIDLGLFRVPEWTAYVAVGVGTAALTYAVAR